MRTQNTFSTLFLIQKSKAINNEALLYARVTVNGKRADISLKKRISLPLWVAHFDRPIQLKELMVMIGFIPIDKKLKLQ